MLVVYVVISFGFGFCLLLVSLLAPGLICFGVLILT